MPYVLVDYSKCNGDGACATNCPGSVFELLVDWCKPKDVFVKNYPALEGFHEHILLRNQPVPVTIRYHVPECFLCWQCIGACPSKAIDVQYDDLDFREYLLPAGGETALQEGQ